MAGDSFEIQKYYPSLALSDLESLYAHIKMG